jgi:hypothetical protein
MYLGEEKLWQDSLEPFSKFELTIYNLIKSKISVLYIKKNNNRFLDY